MSEFGRRVGDMLKSVYDPDKDGIIAIAQTEADITEAEVDSKISTHKSDANAHHAKLHKANHQSGGSDEIDLTGLSGKSLVVDRGDPSAFDWSLLDLTIDGNWHDLDCSGIVPEGAKFIWFRLYLIDDVTGSWFQMRKKGNSNVYNTLTVLTQAANIPIEAQGFVACDENRMVQYRATNTTFTMIYLLVRGWII